MYHHINYFSYKGEDKFEFDRDAFINGIVDKSLLNFTEMLIESQLFNEFIENDTFCLEHRILIEPIRKEVSKIKYRQFKTISSIKRKCGSCFEELEAQDPVYQYPNKIVVHRQCVRCDICGKFSEIKKCSLCNGCEDKISDDVFEKVEQRWKEKQRKAKFEESCKSILLRTNANQTNVCLFVIRNIYLSTLTDFVRILRNQ